MESLSQTTSTTNLGVEFIIDYFNKNTQQTLCFIAIYKPPLRCNFFFHLKNSYLKNTYKWSKYHN